MGDANKKYRVARNTVQKYPAKIFAAKVAGDLEKATVLQNCLDRARALLCFGRLTGEKSACVPIIVEDLNGSWKEKLDILS